MTRKRAVVGGLFVVALAGAILWIPNRDQSYDRGFDTRVIDPAYRMSGPVVAYDEGHRNVHTTTTGYKPFADLLRHDGYSVRATTQPLSATTLEGASVLVLVLARGVNDTEDGAAYSEDEGAAVEAWTRRGGSLLLVADHWPFGSAAASLARRFDVDISAGMAQDPTYHDPERGDSHLVFSDENRLLRDHPIIHGRTDAERVRRVLTFTGTSIRGPADAASFLALSEAATDRPPGPATAKRNGGDVRVEMEYGAQVPANGRAQGIALECGAGRLVVLADAGMLRAQRPHGGIPVGMNVPGYDNRQLALNIMHWLSRAL